MPARIEDYALLGDCYTAALVSRDGSIDWLCLPRFDSGACFAALLGTPEHGRWLLTPADPVRAVRRRYRGNSLVLETDYDTDEGSVTVVDCLPVGYNIPDLVRVVEGKRGRVRMRTELVIRFDYGSIVPWVQRVDGGLSATAGPDRLLLFSNVPLHGVGYTSVADFTVSAGQREAFTLLYHQSHEPPPPPTDPDWAVQATTAWWERWAAACSIQGKWREPIVRSLVTLKMLTYYPTGGIVAAATTSLPEWIGGVRNWDYRMCWIRDATLTLYALLAAGYRNEARAWREWLLRAAAGHPSELQIMYGIGGERRLTEFELSWLPGYCESRPVRIGNAAHEQLQIDVYGELMDTLHACNRYGLETRPYVWEFQKELLKFLEKIWQEPDHGLWEIRGEARPFTLSRIMCWVAFDRAIKSIERYGYDGPREHWQELRDGIAAQVCEKGYDAKRNTFVQYYGASDLDASLLLIPQLGFLPPDDRRVIGTIEAIERELVVEGLVMRYSTKKGVDGLPGGEGAFLACSFWLANSLNLIGRHDDAVRLFERLLGLRNDLGLLSEEYDPRAKRFLGNFPQAFSHVGIINTALHLAQVDESAAARGNGDADAKKG